MGRRKVMGTDQDWFVDLMAWNKEGICIFSLWIKSWRERCEWGEIGDATRLRSLWIEWNASAENWEKVD